MENRSQLYIPVDALVLLIGPTGSGKSDFAGRHFRSSAVISDEDCREWVSDDPLNQTVSREAFHVMMTIVNHRLQMGRLTVIDSPALNPRVREQYRQLADEHERPVITIVFDTPLDRCRARNRQRDLSVADQVVTHQVDVFQDQLDQLRDEPYDQLHVLQPEDKETSSVRLQNHQVRVEDEGPFDVIGDLHGCLNELKRLLERLGYERDRKGYVHSENRKAVFLGDLGDRGPDSVGCLALVLDMVEQNRAYYVPGNHCEMLYEYLTGEREELVHGLQTTVQELNELPKDQRGELTDRFLRMYETAPPYLVLDGGDLVVSHAGIRTDDIGDVNERIVDFCLYGDTTGETGSYGYPVRRDWALAHRGDPLVVYGHTPSAKAMEVNGTVNIDQGAVYGGYLSSYCYPEGEFVSVKSEEAYHPDPPSDVVSHQFKRADKRHHLDLFDREFTFSPAGDEQIHISEQVVRRGLDRVSRSDVSLNQLVYLPSEPARAMPAEGHESNVSDCCEEMVAHFEDHGIQKVRVLREASPMTSCAVVCCRNEEVARTRFGTSNQTLVWSNRGRAVTLPDPQKKELRERIFDMPWLIEQEVCVIVEGLLYDPTSGEEMNHREWIHRDRFELEEVVSRLEEARSRVGAIEAVLDDLDDIHGQLGVLAERAFGEEDAIAPAQEAQTGTVGSKQGEPPDQMTDSCFVPMRFVSTDERLMLGTVQEVPVGNEIWGPGMDDLDGEGAFRTIDLEEAAREIQELWTDYPGTHAWWILPQFADGATWTPDLVPAFHLVGRQNWELSELISPRRWWGKEASAHWAGWNSSREIFALGRESARRFSGALNPSFVVQTVAAQAGLLHW